MTHDDNRQEFTALKADINHGLADVAAGRVADFDAAKIIEHGKRLLAKRTHPQEEP